MEAQAPPHSPRLSDAQREWIKAGPKLPEALVLRKGSIDLTFLILDRDADGRVMDIEARMGMKGFVLRVQDPDDGAVYAAKICSAADYDGGRSERDEQRLANVLRQAGALFAAPIHSGRVVRFDGMPGDEVEFVCFVSDWIDGLTLEALCIQKPEMITGEFIVRAANQVFRAVHFLSHHRLKHDDLHWGNVIVRPPVPGLALTPAEENEYSLCLVDTGSLKDSLQPTGKSHDDHLSMVDILHSLYNAAWRERQLVASSPQFFDRFRMLLEALTDEDPLRHFPTPDLFVAALADLEKASRPDFAIKGEHSFSPFDGISAEHLADDQTLLDLFSQALPWFPSLLATKPVVLSGPRGCGKSMLFRYLSAPTQAKAMVAGAAQTVDSFGVYISCATHLQNNLVWIARKPGRAKELAGSIATYFQLVIAREFVRALGLVNRIPDARARFNLNDATLDQWISWVNAQFPTPIETPRLPRESRLMHFANDLERTAIKVHNTMLQQRSSEVILSDGFLGSITSKLVELNPAFSVYPVVFLLDDYTENRLHKEVQATVNRIVFERRSSHFFKVSCERMGFDAVDSEGVKIDSHREFDEMDAGQHAVEDCTTKDAERFLVALIDKRLARAGWKGRCETLLGSSGDFSNDINLANYIRSDGSRQGRHYFYFGTTHLARLWSGDIATTLQIVKDICIQGDVGPDTTKTVTQSVQHSSIVAISKAYRNRVKDLHPYGQQLSRILEAFGQFARTVLVNGTLNRKQNARRTYRIEMTLPAVDTFIDQLEKVNGAAADIARELLRRSVFNPLRESRGKEGPATRTIRLEMRNIYRPAFGLSLEKADEYLDVKTVEEFASMLIEPSKYLEGRTMSYRLGKNQDRDTRFMFGEEE